MKKIANRDVQTKGIAFSGISKGVWVALAVLCVINIVMHLFVMPSLPERIPMHWGANGAVDGWGPRWAASAMGALPLGLLFLFYVVPRVDPKGEAYRKSGKFYQGFVTAFTVLLCGMTWLSELSVWGIVPARGAVNVLVSVKIGVLFIGMGNYMPRIRQNYTLGIKTPWALADPDNWRRTHRMGGRCFIVMGMLLIVIGLISSAVPESQLMMMLLVAVFVPVIVPFVYSYLIWRKSQRI